MTVEDNGREAFELAVARDPGVKNEPEAPAQVEQPAEEAQSEAQAEGEQESAKERDPETGKFIAKGQKEAGEEEADDGKNGGNIPSGRLRKEAEARRAAEAERDTLKARLDELSQQVQRLSQPQPRERTAEKQPDPPPNLLENPEGFVDHRLKPLQEQQAQMVDRFSRMMAVQSYGKEAVETAFKALNDEAAVNPAARFEIQRIWQSEHPYGALVEWHKGQMALKEFGTDPKAYEGKLRDKLLNDPEFLKQAIEKAKADAQAAPAAGNGRSTTTISLPPSLAARTGPGAGASRIPADDPAAEFRSMFAR
jgi:hypothetical protein